MSRKLRTNRPNVNSQQHKPSLSVVGEIISGPIPPSEMLVGYNKAHPNAADRILKMAEQGALHKQKMEQRVVASQFKLALLGQIFSTTITLCSIISGFLIVFFGNSSVALRVECAD